ncbi:MAG: tetratricopeptide repeat protein, partial [Planctomycetota bacterium]
MGSRKYDQAVVLLKQILEKEPADRSARIQLGLSYLQLSKYDEALAEAEYGSKGPNSAQPAAVNFIKGSVWLQRKNYDKAVSFLKEAVFRQSNVAESHYFLGHALVGLGRTQEAINEFNTAINVAPTFIPAKLDLAKFLSR